MGITDITLTLARRTAITVLIGFPAACSSARAPGMADMVTTGGDFAGIGTTAGVASTNVANSAATLAGASDERVFAANTVSAAMTFAAGAAKVASEAANPTVEASAVNPTVGEVSMVVKATVAAVSMVVVKATVAAARMVEDTAKIFSK
jgi:hypothetical protein